MSKAREIREPKCRIPRLRVFGAESFERQRHGQLVAAGALLLVAVILVITVYVAAISGLLTL